MIASRQVGLVAPGMYVDPQHQAREFETLFAESWIFAGLMFELLGRSHMGMQVGNTGVLLQVDESGKPRAFLNVCSHRHAQLCETGRHEGAVRCPYHGWVYDRQGIPVGIPSKQCFPQVVADPVKHRLTEFACEAVGQFIFIRLSPSGVSLHEYMGNQHEFLMHASVGMTEVQDEFREDVPANWKVVVENALEGYHVPAVHNKTFMQVDGMSKEDTAPAFFLDDPRHSHLDHAANPDWVKSFQRLKKKIGQWPWRFDHYTHHLIFPNLTVTSFMGYSFHIQRFDPVSPEITKVHSRTVGVEFADATEVGRKLMQRIHDDGHAFTRKVFVEDGGICAKVQAGVRNARRFAVIGMGIEDRVAHFQQTYVAAMGRPSP